MGGGEHQAGVGPGAVGPVAVGVLVLFAEFEGGDAQVGQGQGGFGGVCFGLPAQELWADPLELFADVQFPGVEVDPGPR